MVELMIKVTAVMVNMIIKERMKIAVYDLGVLGYFAPKILYMKNWQNLHKYFELYLVFMHNYLY